MSTNTVVTLDTRRAKHDGTFPLILRLGHNRRTLPIPLDIYLNKKDWDSKARVVKNSYTGSHSVTRLNNIIQRRKADAQDIIIKLKEADQLRMLTVAQVKQRIEQKISSTSFFSFAKENIEELKKAKRFGTARSYQGVVDVLTTYMEKRNLLFKDISYSFLTKFETNHLAKGNAYNGLAVYMRTIRAIYNSAIKAGLIEKEYYPFDDYKIKTTPTEKRALEITVLNKIIGKILPEGHHCINARNYFVASYMMYGMNFMDMAFLKKTNIINGRIKYRRSKTSKLYDIKITPGLQQILNYYLIDKNDSDYVFPIVKRESIEFQLKDIQWARKRYNKKLKILATLCEIEETLTSYVSRHSFATQAMLQEVPINAISAMLGHSSIKTTEIYLKSLPSNILDDYNAKLLQ